MVPNAVSPSNSITALLLTEFDCDWCVLSRHEHVFCQINHEYPDKKWVFLLCFFPYISSLFVSTRVICTEAVLPFLWLVLACEKNIRVIMICARGGEHAGELYLDTLQKLWAMSCLICYRHCSLGAFANLRRATVSCTMSVCVSDWNSDWNVSASCAQIFIKFNISGLFEYTVCPTS